MKLFQKPAVLLIAVLLSLHGAVARAGGESGLVDKMGKLQYFTHKTGLALLQENTRLAGFYVHELEELIEELESFGQYRSHEIGKLFSKMLAPQLHELESQLKQGKAAEQWQAYNTLIKGCNSCHQATKHEFIRIEFRQGSHYLQSFSR